jgi:death on curing protein
MSRPILFLTVEHVLAIHARVIQDFGGDLVVRDPGLLESAAAMPSAQFGGRFLHPTIPEMAGAYFFHLCRNHPFVDGNKRTALAAAEVFLLMNDHAFTATNRQLENLTLALADGRLSKKEVLDFFQKHTEKTI